MRNEAKADRYGRIVVSYRIAVVKSRHSTASTAEQRTIHAGGPLNIGNTASDGLPACCDAVFSNAILGHSAALEEGEKKSETLALLHPSNVPEINGVLCNSGSRATTDA